MKKQRILEVENVYTAHAFTRGHEVYVAAGSETEALVSLYELDRGKTTPVSGCPGGVMSFIPMPGKRELYFSIMGLFPPFLGAEAGVFAHRRSGDSWTTTKAMELPFAHRCEVLVNAKGIHLFVAAVSKHKANPADWSRPGLTYVCELDPAHPLPLKPELIDDSLTRNHGMLRTRIKGSETLCISGAEGIFYFEQAGDGSWNRRQLFHQEVSEFTLIDLDGDGQDELVTIEPFHGQHLRIYKWEHGSWIEKARSSLSFGHGLSSGTFQGEPVIVVGNRRGSFALLLLRVEDLKAGKVREEILEADAGPTQTQVFQAHGRDYILSANQRKHEVAIYH